MKKNRSIHEHPKNTRNPFISNLLIPKKKTSQYIGVLDDKVILDKRTDEEETLVIGTSKTVDKEQFVKVYISQIELLFGLTKTALKVLSYIWDKQKFGDTVIVDSNDCKNVVGFKSLTSVFTGITELLNADIIAKGEVANVYFTNPAVFYKGDRLLLVTEYKQSHIPHSILKKITE